MTKRVTLECMGDLVEIYIDEDGDVVFDGWDEEAEMAFIGFGDTERSPCWTLARAIDDDRLDYELIDQARAGNTEMIGALIDAGADVHTEGYLSEGEPLFQDILPEHFSDNTDQPLRLAANQGHADAVYLLLEKGANIHAANDDALREAARWGHADVVEVLLNARPKANIHADDDYALRWAAEEGHADVVEVLLNARPKANIHANYDYALTTAAHAGHADVVEALLKHNANVHAHNNKALRWAAEEGHGDIVKMLLKKGANVYAISKRDLRVLNPKVSRILKAWIEEHDDD